MVGIEFFLVMGTPSGKTEIVDGFVPRWMNFQTVEEATEHFNQKIARLLIREFRRYLEECEQQILEFEIKHGLDYKEFQEKVEKDELGDPFSYELEQDSIRWEDLLTEKKHWLSQLKAVEGR